MGLSIAIDGAAMCSGQPGGYKTYTTNLVRNLRRIDSGDHYLLLLDRAITLDHCINWQDNVLPRRGSLGLVWREQFGLPRYLSAHDADLIHSPAGTAPIWSGLPLVVTIHDTIEFSQPLPAPYSDIRVWSMRTYNRLVQTATARRARKIIAVSEYARGRILDRFAVAPDRVVTIHGAPSPAYRMIPPSKRIAETQSQFGISNYVLAINSAAPHKNILRLIEAYRALPDSLRKHHKLALVCTHSSARAKVAAAVDKFDLKENVIFLTEVSDAQMLRLYNNACVFVFPSLEEGFGLPPLEAMACGVPVVASNTTSMPEVLGSAALLVSPTDTCALADAIAAVLSDRALASQLSEQGLAQSKRFSWELTARRTLSLYHLAAHG